MQKIRKPTLRLRLNKSVYDLQFFVVLGIVTIFFVGIIYLPYYLVHSKLTPDKFRESGQIGDTIGGIMQPAIAIIASYLTFIAFWVQYKANQDQKEQIMEQIRANDKESDERKVFELITFHKENVDHLEIEEAGIRGHRVFHYMYHEFLNQLIAVDLVYERFIKEKDLHPPHHLSKEEKATLAYHIFYYGKGYLVEFERKNKLQGFGVYYQSILEDILNLHEKCNIKGEVPLPEDKASLNNKLKILGFEVLPFSMFDGYQHLLSHYYRHLYFTISTIHDLEPKLFTDKEKYLYAKALRSQLSNYEQALLFFSSLTKLGEEWIPFINEYKLVKNIPIDLIEDKWINLDAYIKLIGWREEKDGRTGKESYFEWYENE